MNRLLRSTLAAATALALATGLAPSAMADNGDDIPPEILSVDYPRTVVPGKTYTVTVTARDNTLWLRDFQLWNPGYAGMRMTNGTMTSAQLRPDGTWLMTWAYNADDVPYGLYSGHTIRVSDDNGNDTILPLEPVTVDDPAHPIDNTPTITGKPAVGATLTASIKAGAGAKTTFGWSSVKRGHSDGPTYLLDNWDYDQFSDRTVSLSSMTVFPDGVRRARHATSDVIGLGSLEPKTPTMATPVFTKPLAVGYQHPGDLFAYGGPVTTSVQWFRDGKMIAGATGDTFALKATDVGHRLRARVISATTSPYYTQAPITQYGPERTVAAATLAATRPEIRSFSKSAMENHVGVKLNALAGSWTRGTTLTYQWTRNGKAIKGATKPSYTPVRADHKQRLAVAVTGRQPGYANRTLTSVATKPLLRTQPTYRIDTKGNHRAGFAVKVVRDPSAGSWVKGTKVSYQWYRSGKPIRGATKVSYKIQTADRKKTLKVRATGTKYDYVTATASRSVKIR